MDKLLITWTDEYFVEYDKIDEQHKKLVDLINKLYDAFLKADAKNVIFRNYK